MRKDRKLTGLSNLPETGQNCFPASHYIPCACSVKCAAFLHTSESSA